MKYMLEFSTMTGDGLGEEPWSLIESDTPIPIPNVGDRINLRGTDTMATVVNRQMDVFGNDEDDLVIKFQVFCRDIQAKD